MQSWFSRPGARIALAVVLYSGLLAVCFATLSDWRIRSVTVFAVVAFFGLTLLHPRKPAPVPWGRAADVGGDEEDDAASVPPAES